MLSDKLQKETEQITKMAKSASVPNRKRSAGTVLGRPFGPFDACYRDKISASKETPIPGIPISGFSDRACLIAVSRFSEKPMYFSCYNREPYRVNAHFKSEKSYADRRGSKSRSEENTLSISKSRKPNRTGSDSFPCES